MNAHGISFEAAPDDYGMGDLLDTLNAVGDALNPFATSDPSAGDPNAASGTVNVASGSVSQAAPTTTLASGTVLGGASAVSGNVNAGPGGPSPAAQPSFAGDPQTWANRVAKLNTVMGTVFPGDINALDLTLMGVVRTFQAAHSLSQDGEMGPATEAALDAAIAAQGQGGASVVPQNPLAAVPASPAAPLPAAPGNPNVSPASVTDQAQDNTKLYIGIGVAAVALLGLAYYATK